jgi:hypothetical protein
LATSEKAYPKKVRCSTCRHWDRKPAKQGERDEGIGKCYGRPPWGQPPFSQTYHFERCPNWEQKDDA